MIESAERYRFGLWTLVALVVGNAIGAGIYTTSGYSLQSLGSREWVLLAWLVGGLVALCGALSYGMLAQRMQESGGEYLYLHRSIHPLAGFIAGWISLLAGFPGAIAFAASALESYLRAATDAFVTLPGDSIALFVTIAAGTAHIIRVQVGARMHEWIVAFMLAALLLIIGWSLFSYVSTTALPVTADQVPVKFSFFAFANSLVWISLSYSGFNAAAYVTGEVHDAKRNVMRGMVIGTLLTLVLCVVLNAIMLYSAEIETLSGQPQIAALAAEAISGDTGRRVIEIVIALSLLTSITAMAMAGPRVYAKMAEDGALPRLFMAKDGAPPRASIALQVVISMALILVADLRGLLSYLGMTLSLCLALAVSSLFVRHWRWGEKPNSRWYPFAPLVFVICTVSFAVLSAINEPKQFFAVIPTILIGCAAYFLSQFFYRPNTSTQVIEQHDAL